jgi:hypothetical protein
VVLQFDTACARNGCNSHSLIVEGVERVLESRPPQEAAGLNLDLVSGRTVLNCRGARRGWTVKRRTDDVVVAIENHQPVHLPGKSDASDLISDDSGGSQRTANRFERRVGPVFRALLSPERLLHHYFFVRNRDCGSFPSA